MMTTLSAPRQQAPLSPSFTVLPTWMRVGAGWGIILPGFV